MRTYGRVTDEYGNKTWVEIQTDVNGFNDYVYLTALIQELKLNLGESPFWGDRGIPAKSSVVQQVAPDYYTMLMQQRYSKYFLNLIIVKTPPLPGYPETTPTYRINVTTHQGVQEELYVPV